MADKETIGLRAFSPTSGSNLRIGQPVYKDGQPKISKICLVCDGCGSLGFYDVIYVHVDDELQPTYVYPAHSCHSWELIK